MVASPSYVLLHGALGEGVEQNPDVVLHIP